MDAHKEVVFIYSSHRVVEENEMINKIGSRLRFSLTDFFQDRKDSKK